jgi:3-oxoadipate enol-lactonase
MSPAVALHHRIDGAGDAPPLLLGPSLGTNLTMWDPQLPALSGERRVIRFDHRGHGGSPVPLGAYSIADLGGDVLALLDHLGLQHVDYCGLSIGGMVGQLLAINAPERIRRLVIMCSSPHTVNGSAFADRAATVREAGTPAVVADAVVARWFTEPFAASHPDVIARHRAMIAATDPEGYAGCCEAVAGHDVRSGLSGVHTLTLVISAAQDAAISPDQGRDIANQIPGARFELLDPGAHLASAERAEDVNHLISDHLGGPVT